MSHSIVVQPAPQKNVLGTKEITYHTQVSNSQAHDHMSSMCYLPARKIQFLPFTVSTETLKMI